MFRTLAAFVLTVAAAGADAGEVSVIRIATVPAGAEVTGIAVNDLGELFFNAQHPAGKKELEGDGPAALIGYVDDIDIRNFTGASVAIPDEEARDKVHVARGEYVVLGMIGDELGDGTVLGGVYDAGGELMFVSNNVDYNAFIPLTATEAYLYTAFEGGDRAGVSALSRLKLRRAKGRWRGDLGQSKMMDLRSVDGGWRLCFGEISPWGTPIFSEEYPFYNTALWNHPDLHDDDDRPLSNQGNDMVDGMPRLMNRYLGKASNPYRYGYAIEMRDPAAEKSVDLVKRFALGRFSHENVAIMGDGRPVYQTDDDTARYTDAYWNTKTGGVFFKFVADNMADLSAGTLLAAKVTQDPGSDPRQTGFKVDWIKLAHGRDQQISKWIAEYDNIGPKDYEDGQSNFISDDDVYNWAEGKLKEDLNGDGKIGDYPDDRPAFLESRKAAAAMGATNEWNKLEGVTKVNGTVFIAVSEIAESMEKGWGHINWASGHKDESEQGHIALDKERCGAIYRAILTADYNVTRLDPVVIGTTTDGDKRCDDNGIARPDNLLGLANGSLLVGEDAGEHAHPVDMLWLIKWP
jgi:secreted PhoX family phosphatase